MAGPVESKGTQPAKDDRRPSASPLKLIVSASEPSSSPPPVILQPHRGFTDHHLESVALTASPFRREPSPPRSVRRTLSCDKRERTACPSPPVAVPHRIRSGGSGDPSGACIGFVIFSDLRR